LLGSRESNFQAIDYTRDIAHVDQVAHTIVVQNINDFDLQIPQIGVGLRAIGFWHGVFVGNSDLEAAYCSVFRVLTVRLLFELMFDDDLLKAHTTWLQIWIPSFFDRINSRNVATALENGLCQPVILLLSSFPVTGFVLSSSFAVHRVAAKEFSHLTVREDWLQRRDLCFLRADQNLVWDRIQQVLELLLLESSILLCQVHACLRFLLDVEDSL